MWKTDWNINCFYQKIFPSAFYSEYKYIRATVEGKIVSEKPFGKTWLRWHSAKWFKIVSCKFCNTFKVKCLVSGTKSVFSFIRNECNLALFYYVKLLYVCQQFRNEISREWQQKFNILSRLKIRIRNNILPTQNLTNSINNSKYGMKNTFALANMPF